MEKMTSIKGIGSREGMNVGTGGASDLEIMKVSDDSSSKVCLGSLRFIDSDIPRLHKRLSVEDWYCWINVSKIDV
jgi:hypothetical protein